MPEELICPYCEKEQDCHEPDEINAEFALTECEHCGKSFWYSVTVTRDYDSWTDEEDKAMMAVAETLLNMREGNNATD